MKKILALLLAIIMIFTFAACGKKDNTGTNSTAEYKLGMGVSVSLDSSADKTADKNATAKAEATVASVVFDKDGKVVAIELDCAQTAIEVKDGKLVDLNKVDLRTKYEKKGDYGMTSASPIGKEWFEQVDALETWCVGKTAAEIASSAGTDADLAAGCTIKVDALLDAIAKAATDAQAVSFATASDIKLGLDVLTDVSGSNDKNDKGDATAKFASTFGATVLDADGKVLAAIIDEIEPKVSVDSEGKVSAKTYKDTKRNLKEEYGMVAYNASPIGKEWYEQADAFSDYLVGKTATEIAAISTKTDANGNVVAADEDLLATCTIKIANYIKVTSDAAAAAK